MNLATKTLPYDDLCLNCIQCDSAFDYPATEQDFFAKRGLEAPKRCRRCRTTKSGDKAAFPTSQPYKKPAPQSYQSQKPAYESRQPAQTMKADYSDQPKPKDMTQEIEELRSDYRKMKMDLDEVRLELKELKLNIRARKIAQMEKTAATKSV
jgi:hypothetical protein